MGNINISVMTPVLNEEFFLPLYLQAVTSYADEVLILDGGSTDRSISIIKAFQRKSSVPIFCWQKPQRGRPYSQDWKEGERRNFLLQQARGDWVLVLDPDEFLSDNFSNLFRQVILPDRDTLIFGFAFVPFWGSTDRVRLSVSGDMHWEGDIYRLIRRRAASYDNRGNHALLLCNGKHPAACRKRVLLKEATLFHYHYALGPRVKENDNRRGDLGLVRGERQPDWEYRPEEYEIKTHRFEGKHPHVIREYLRKDD